MPPKKENEIAMRADEKLRPDLDRRLMQELNLLKLEGTLFCFDPKEARRRRGALTLADARKQPVSLKIDLDFGQPSVLAYKVLQAIFVKLAEDGCDLTEDGKCLYSDTISFSQRELAALTGRSWSGKNVSEQLYRSLKQLQHTSVTAHLFDKEKSSWILTSFVVLPSVLLAGRGETITRCAVRLAPEVMSSLNRRHVAFFNLHRLDQLDTLGLVLYKRVFFHLSNLMHENVQRGQLRFTKDYETICREWLGGLKPLRFKSKILQEQLGRHLDALQATGLIRKYTLEKNKAEDGFNLRFYPGKGFFDDYQAYYIDQKQPSKRLSASAELTEVKALELVAYFHRQLGRTTKTKFKDIETAYADELLIRHSDAEIRDLIDYGIREAATTRFDMLYFVALKTFVETWEKDQTQANERKRQEGIVKACPFCNEVGMLELKEEGSNQLIVSRCPHRVEMITQIEDRLHAYRI